MARYVRAAFVFLVVLSVSGLFPASVTFAQTDIYIRGSGKLFPIALPRLCLQGGEGTAQQDIPSTIARDLDISGYFQVLNANSYIESPGKCGGPEGVAYSDWSVIGAEGVVRGTVTVHGNSVSVQMYLHDVGRQQIVLGKEYEGDLTQVSRIAHRFANEIMKYFTGEYGVFGTQIAFSSRIGRFKELFVMDMDGSNLRQLTNDRSLALSSSWDPTGSRLVYTSYRQRVPDLFMIDVATKRTSQITRGSALEVGGKFLQDGQSILTSRQQEGESDLIVVGVDGNMQRRLTPANGAIDVSADFSPDFSKIVFCSNRGGGPQIYVMDASGGGAKRISFVTSSYCTSPSWSPKNDKIAFVCRADGGFQVFTANIDGSGSQQLTSYGDNEDPDWSPDGKFLTFSSTSARSGAPHIVIMRADGSNMKEITSGRLSDGQPSWGPVTW